MKLRRKLAINIISYRKKFGMSQKKLAKLAGLNINHIGNIENYRSAASIDVLENIAKALDTDPCILLSENKISFKGTGISTTLLVPVDFKKGEAAFCFWTNYGMEFHPLSKSTYRTSITMLALLQANGISGKDLITHAKLLHIPIFNDYNFQKR